MRHYKGVLILLIIFLFGLLVGCSIKNFSAPKNLSGVAVAKDIKSDESVTAKDKEKEVQKASVFFFHSRNCSSCNKIRPVWNSLKKDFKKEFNFYEIDVDLRQNAPLCIEFLVTTIPTIYIEDVPFRNRVYINPAMYGYLPRFEEELSRYLDMRRILKKGME